MKRLGLLFTIVLTTPLVAVAFALAGFGVAVMGMLRAAFEVMGAE